MNIMIIEDCTIAQEMMTEVVKSAMTNHTYKIQSYSNGSQALSSYRTFNPDLILLDLNIQGEMHGMEICSMLRKNGFKNAIFIITADDNYRTIQKGLESGANDYLTKPINFVSLKEKIQNKILA